jgi:cyclopropane fatty-acyl-phospholipid synthase-like methyltransferase
VRVACEATGDAPILDIGCGCGEWLICWWRTGMPRGVELNRVMAAHAGAGPRCRRSRCSRLPARARCQFAQRGDRHSCYRTFALQRVIELFDETRRVLKPGGVAIFETLTRKTCRWRAISCMTRRMCARRHPSDAIRARSLRIQQVEIVPLHVRDGRPALAHDAKVATVNRASVVRSAGLRVDRLQATSGRQAQVRL